MVESTPSKPYTGYATDLLRVESNMRLRRKRLLTSLNRDEIAPTVVAFPLMGVGEFTDPVAPPGVSLTLLPTHPPTHQSNRLFSPRFYPPIRRLTVAPSNRLLPTHPPTYLGRDLHLLLHPGQLHQPPPALWHPGQKHKNKKGGQGGYSRASL